MQNLDTTCGTVDTCKLCGELIIIGRDTRGRLLAVDFEPRMDGYFAFRGNLLEPASLYDRRGRYRRHSFTCMEKRQLTLPGF